MQIGVLHPGAMGVSVAAALVDAGHEVHWCSEGRSEATHARMDKLGNASRARVIADHDQLASLVAAVEAIVSVCPPSNAAQLATSVQQLGFAGLFVDANAIAPQTSATISDLFGAAFVDGGIVGPPAWSAGTTRLYLSGREAESVAQWFAGSNLEACVVGTGVSQASALKMAYAAYTKGNAALLLAVNALAEAAGVTPALQAEWALSQPSLVSRSEATAANTAGKAWRFVGEMQEIAQTFAAFGLPPDFHAGAAEVYQRLAVFKDQADVDLQAAIGELLAEGLAEGLAEQLADRLKDR